MGLLLYLEPAKGIYALAIEQYYKAGIVILELLAVRANT